MIRYSGQPLPSGPRIAVFANDAIGNFVMATPLLQLLRQERKPARLDYFGGTRTKELQEASDLFDTSYLLQGANHAEVLAILAQKGEYDLLINLESTAFSKTVVGLIAGDVGLVAGPCIGPGGRGDLPFGSDERGDLWRDKEWIREDIRSRYPFLKSGFIAEIFVRLCYLVGPLPPYRVPRADPGRQVPDVLIATAASLPEKLWNVDAWLRAVGVLREAGLSVGLLGAPPKSQAEHWKGANEEQVLIESGLAEDMRGVLTLPQVVAALGKARLVLTIDNGILHLAAAAGAPTIGLFRHGIHRLWAPPSEQLTVIASSEDSTVARIPVETVEDAIWSRIGEKV